MANPFEVLKITQQADDQLISLLEENIIGTPGASMLYKHADVRKKVLGIGDPYFCNLAIRDKIYGTVCFCGRTVKNLGREQRAFYVRYFTFLNEFRSSHEQNRRGKKSRVREEVAMLMDGHGLVEQEDLLLYAYVDAENTRSGRLIEEFGFTNVGTFHTIPFSRFSPKDDPQVEKLDEEKTAHFTRELSDFYKGYQLVCFDNLKSSGNYFVIRVNGKVVCGVQAIPDQWEILSLPGISGRVMMHLIPKMPGLKRLFNPKYRFVFLEAIYCIPGYEDLLAILLESVLARHGAHSGIICLDSGSELYQSFKKIPMGITHKIMGEKQIEIIVKSDVKNITKSDAPFFVSGYDVL
jgi:hypothetical protein